MGSTKWRCPWCGLTYNSQRSMSDWEQKTLNGEWKRMCNRCATRRLNNPYGYALPMRNAANTALARAAEQLRLLPPRCHDEVSPSRWTPTTEAPE